MPVQIAAGKEVSEAQVKQDTDGLDKGVTLLSEVRRESRGILGAIPASKHTEISL